MTDTLNTLTHYDLLTALLINKAVQREFKAPDATGNTYRELIQFNEHDQLVNFWYHREQDFWTKNEEEYYSLLGFLTEDTELYNYSIVDKLEMEGKLSLRDIVQTLLSLDAAIQVETTTNGNVEYKLIQLVNKTITGFEPSNDDWKQETSLEIDDETQGEIQERYRVVPAIKLDKTE